TREDICHIYDSCKLNREVDDLSGKISKYLPPDVQYACRHWATHLCNASKDNSDADQDRLVDALGEFSRHLLIRWIEALSLLGYVMEAIKALGQAQEWLGVSGYSFIHDFPEVE